MDRNPGKGSIVTPAISTRLAGKAINLKAFTNRHFGDSPNSYQFLRRRNWGNPCQPFKKRIEDKDRRQILAGNGRDQVAGN